MAIAQNALDWWNIIASHEIWGSHGGDFERYYRLEGDALLTGKCFPTYLSNVGRNIESNVFVAC
jgi:hypothetical protein